MDIKVAEIETMAGAERRTSTAAKRPSRPYKGKPSRARSRPKLDSLLASAIDIMKTDRTSFTAQHGQNTPEAIANSGLNDLMHALPDRQPRIPPNRFALRRPILPRQRTGSALAVAVT
jgi:hypothetical protein